MKRILIYLSALLLITISACTPDPDRPQAEVTIPDFNFPQTIIFEQELSAYQIFEGPIADLTPSDDFHVLELSSVLFTDFAHKQRLIKVPAGMQVKQLNDGSLEYPDGTILTKTFFYYKDERDKSLGKRVIETRLLIKENAQWNVATYLWNEDQSSVTLALNGLDTQVSWIAKDGSQKSTLYHVPNENECGTCHQTNSSLSPLGPTLRNLNRNIERDDSSLNQLVYLQSHDVLNEFAISQVAEIVDYKDLAVSSEERARAYLAMNCAHCHNPTGW